MDADLGCGPVRPLDASFAPETVGSTDETLPETESWSGLKRCERVCVCVRALSDVLQDVEDELHHDGLVVPLAPPAVDDGDQHAVQGVEVLSWEGLPVAPSHKSHLELQNNELLLI